MLTSVIQQFDVYLFGKDIKGKFLFCNEKFAAAADLESPQQIIGKTDFDLVWQRQAALFRAGDSKVLAGEPFRNIQEVLHQHQKTSDILVCKNQLLNKSNEVIGVIGYFIDITGNCIRKKSGHYDATKQRFYLGTSFDNAFLSEKQFQVFKQILLGYSSRLIAEDLKLSPRTVETPIDIIKNKMQCSSKGEIIAAAISSGLTHVIDEIE